MQNDYVIRKVTQSYLLSSILIVLAATIGMIVDSIVIGWYLGSAGLAAQSIAMPFFLVFVVLSGTMASGTAIKCAEAIGKDQPRQVNNLFTLAIVFTTLLAVLLTVAGLLWRVPIARQLGARTELLGMVSDYILGLSIGAVPIMLAQILMAAVRTDNSPSLALLAMLAMTAVNSGLDLLVARLDLGMLGMALATSLSYLIAALVCGLHFARPHHTLQLVRIRNLRGDLGSVIQTGLPEAMTRLYSLLRTLILNLLLISIGGIGAVTVYTLRTNANYIIGAIAIGVGHSILPIAGVFFGEEDRRALRDLLRQALRNGLIINIGAGALLMILARPFIALFGVTDPGLVRDGAEAIRLFALSMPLMLINLTLMNYYQSTHNLLLANLICLGESFILIIGLSLLLAHFLGATGVWLAFVLAELLMLLILVGLIRIKSGQWPRSIDDCLLLPAGFGGNPADIFDLSIGNSLADVVTLSRKVSAFCQAQGVDARRSFLLALCIEEMAGNVVRHGFRPGEHRFFDIRILVKGPQLILRVRDNGRRFNPVAWLALQDPGDACANIGIRMISRLATSVDYRYRVGLNNLIIVL